MRANLPLRRTIGRSPPQSRSIPGSPVTGQTRPWYLLITMPGVELVLVLHGYRGFGPLESGLHSPDNDGLKTLGDGMGLSGVLFFCLGGRENDAADGPRGSMVPVRSSRP